MILTVPFALPGPGRSLLLVKGALARANKPKDAKTGRLWHHG
jgi:hypothetical protein